MITNLIDKARERRSKREQNKNHQGLQSLLSTLNISKSQTKQENLITPLNLLLSSQPNESNKTDTSVNKSVDIIQMLNKAQVQYNQSNHLEPASHSTPGGINLQNSPLSTTSSNDPKPIGQWPHNLFLNSNQFIKPEPIRQSIISPALSAASTKSNPILQLLMSNESNNQTLNKSEASMDLKRKLNIQSSSNVLTSPIIGASPSMILTPSNDNNILMSTSKSNTGARPMTVKDFEQNVLNQESLQKKDGMFYLANESSSNNTTSTDYKSNLTFSNQKNSLNLSSSSDSDSSDSETDSGPTSPNGLPLLLTPAAFESSSASSTTSSSYQNDKITEGANQTNQNIDCLNAFFNPQINGFLFPNQFNFSESTNASMANVNSDVNINDSEKISPMTKDQLQQVLIHLLKVIHFLFFNLN